MILSHYIHFSEIDSTNSWALRALEPGGLLTEKKLALPVLVTAERQTTGRGQKTHAWHSPPGCLMFSLIFSPQAWNIPLRHTPLLSFACANALRETLGALLSPEKKERLAIHWPNDIYYLAENATENNTENNTENEKKWQKISGILLEGHASGVMVVGIGLNLLNHTATAPKEVQERMTTLLDLEPNWIHAPILTTQALQLAKNVPGEQRLPRIMTATLALLLENMNLKFQELAENPHKIVRETEACCAQRGTFLTLQTAHGTIRGYCTGLADDGALLIDGRPHHSGQIHF